MRNQLHQYRNRDPRMSYRGADASRLDNLTDAVFGIAVTLLIFNLANPNSFAELITFTKTLPAFMMSISFLMLIWAEHLRFSEIYGLEDGGIITLNTLFIALVIFYVYPLRFLTLFLTNMVFQTDISIRIDGNQVPYLMIYYGFFAFAIYFSLFLLYRRAYKIKDRLQLNDFELFHTRKQMEKMFIMFIVPLLSVTIAFFLHFWSAMLASIVGGFVYFIYTPAMTIWARDYYRKAASFE